MHSSNVFVLKWLGCCSCCCCGLWLFLLVWRAPAVWTDARATLLIPGRGSFFSALFLLGRRRTYLLPTYDLLSPTPKATPLYEFRTDFHAIFIDPGFPKLPRFNRPLSMPCWYDFYGFKVFGKLTICLGLNFEFWQCPEIWEASIKVGYYCCL